MTTIKQTNESAFMQLTNIVTTVFSYPYYEIREKFHGHPICFMEYREKTDLEKRVVEIRFEERKATLSCIYGENNRCNAAWLFFDNRVDVLNYLDYLEKQFVYDFLSCRWMILNYYMLVKEVDGITGFMFYH